MARLHLTGWSTKTLWQICSLLSLFPACISNPAISTFRLGRLCQSRTEVSSRLMNVLININYQQLPLSVFMSNGFLRHTPTNTHAQSSREHWRIWRCDTGVHHDLLTEISHTTLQSSNSLGTNGDMACVCIGGDSSIRLAWNCYWTRCEWLKREHVWID